MRYVTCGLWGTFLHPAACFVKGQGAKDRQPLAFCLLCLLCQTNLLRSLKVQRKKVQAPPTASPPLPQPNTVQIQLKLVLLKEAGHSMSRHITLMQFHLSLLEKRGN